MLSVCPIERLLEVRLFNDLISSTVVLNLLAILYKLSPLTTVYIELSVGVDGVSFCGIIKING